MIVLTFFKPSLLNINSEPNFTLVGFAVFIRVLPTCLDQGISDLGNSSNLFQVTAGTVSALIGAGSCTGNFQTQYRLRSAKGMVTAAAILHIDKVSW